MILHHAVMARGCLFFFKMGNTLHTEVISLDEKEIPSLSYYKGQRVNAQIAFFFLVTLFYFPKKSLTRSLFCPLQMRQRLSAGPVKYVPGGIVDKLPSGVHLFRALHLFYCEVSPVNENKQYKQDHFFRIYKPVC